MNLKKFVASFSFSYGTSALVCLVLLLAASFVQLVTPPVAPRYRDAVATFGIVTSVVGLVFFLVFLVWFAAWLFGRATDLISRRRTRRSVNGPAAA